MGSPLANAQPDEAPRAVGSLPARSAMAWADFSPFPLTVNARAPVAPAAGWLKSPTVIPALASEGA